MTLNDDPYIKLSTEVGAWARGYKTFSCSTQLSTEFQLLIKTKIPTVSCSKSLRCYKYHAYKFLALSPSDVIFIMLINVKMPTIVGILTF